MTRRPEPPRGTYPPPGARRAAPRRAAPRMVPLPAIILGAFAALGAALFVGLMGVYAAYTSGLPNPQDLENFELSEGSSVVSADGIELATFAAEQRRVLAFEEIPELLVNAQVAAEDDTFWVNPCIDFQSIVRAAIQNLSAGEEVSGGSTICQQLVRIRLFDPELMADPDRRFERKIKEWILALRVGETYGGQEGREKILEMYMNQVYYGNQAYGIWAAANTYFGKDTRSPEPEQQLTVGEAALLVGLVRAPSALDPTAEAVEQTDADGNSILVVPDEAGAKRVQGFVLDNMVESGYITAAEAEAAANETIILAPPRDLQYKAPHFVYAVRRAAAELLGNEDLLDRGGLEIATTLEYDNYQRFAEKWAGVAYDLDRLTDEELIAKYGEPALAWIKQLQGRNINNDALVTLNYRTGAVLAYVGSANFYGEATPAHQPAFDVIGQAYRQSGSAFKPVTYATGFERGVLSPATLFMDVKGEIVDGFEVPNADGGERGPVRVRDALKYSWNIPVTKAQQLIGTENLVAQAERMGLEWDPAHGGEIAVPSMTLGTLGVHMLDLAGAYGMIANGGILAEPYLIETITDRAGTVIYNRSEDAPEPERVLSEQSAYLVTDILADNTDPAQNSIWGQRFQLLDESGSRRPATLKTGTTNDFKDLQAFGYLAPDVDPAISEGAILTGVWVGNSDFSAIADVFAADGPTFIWHDYMAEVVANLGIKIRDFPRPTGIVELEVDAISGMRPGEFTESTITELFAESNQPTQEDTVHRELRIEEETGKIWQEGCGDFVTASPSGGPDASAAPGSPQAEEKVFIDLGELEASHPTWQAANRLWIERFRGKESSLRRAPAPTLDAPLAPAEKCTPGEVPTSSPSPTPSPTAEPTPEPTPTPILPTPTLPPLPTFTPVPTPTATP
ncbi:MAG TPA: transglycosylase domain-containing protein [Candidatus Dormibacteraeota bacterium]|nr:transglycosylase domain-containing protein [Candidatus Dormibacteraeota bacterium]